MTDDQRKDDHSLRRTTKAQNAEAQPDPAAGDPGATGARAADEVENLEDHSRRTTDPQEPGATRAGGTPPGT